MAGVFAYQQVQDICTGQHMHQLGAFATVGCKCKSKSNILTNVHLRTGAIRKMEASGFGVQAICAKAPSLGLALFGRYELDSKGQFILAESPQGLDNFNAGPFRKLVDRLKSTKVLQPSHTLHCGQVYWLQYLHLERYAVYDFFLLRADNLGSEPIASGGSQVYS